MYATEKYVRLEVKELVDRINSLSTDLSGDISYLHDQILEIKEILASLQLMISEKND